jgi:hypothetical protein
LFSTTEIAELRFEFERSFCSHRDSFRHPDVFENTNDSIRRLQRHRHHQLSLLQGNQVPEMGYFNDCYGDDDDYYMYKNDPTGYHAHWDGFENKFIGAGTTNAKVFVLSKVQ